MNTIPTDWKNCATCSYWCGQAVPDAFRKFVQFEDKPARCSYYNAPYSPMASCSNHCSRWK